MKKMARVQSRGIANRNVWAKEETPLTRAERSYPNSRRRNRKELLPLRQGEREFQWRVDQLDVFPLKSISIPSLGEQHHHKSNHLSQRSESLSHTLRPDNICSHISAITLVQAISHPVL